MKPYLEREIEKESEKPVAKTTPKRQFLETKKREVLLHSLLPLQFHPPKRKSMLFLLIQWIHAEFLSFFQEKKTSSGKWEWMK